MEKNALKVHHKISVCMAVYNGETFLDSQVRSILSQLQDLDEVVVVDDASVDHSLKILRNIPDPRVHVYRNDRNCGVLASFEKALRIATGDILFLSDQDDLWLHGKVIKIMDVFAQNPQITLVASDAKVIDGNGSLIADSFFALRGRFASGVTHNLIKNKYLGCTLAFRRKMIDYFLPIPNNVPMHDMWFGMMNDIYGETFFIDRPLIAYRRHDSNLSPTSGAPAIRKIIWRWNLIKNLLLNMFLNSRKCR